MKGREGAEAGGKAGDDGKTEKKCNYCDKPGHLWAECRTRIAAEGAAGGAKGKGKKGKRGRAAGASPRARAKDVCTYCNKTGHKEKDCLKKKKDQRASRILMSLRSRRSYRRRKTYDNTLPRSTPNPTGEGRKRCRR